MKKSIVKKVARYIWNQLDEIDNMHPSNINELCKQADKIAKVKKDFERLPKWLQNEVGNIRKSQLN